MKLSGSDKVIRWKLLIQQYNFTIEYIKGPDNEVADAFSRLCSSEECSRDPDPDIICLHEKFEIPDEVYDTIAAVHNSVIGHRGVDRTINKLRANGYN